MYHEESKGCILIFNVTDKPIINFVIDEDLLKRVDGFWHKNRFRNRAAAIKWLLTWALDQKPKPEDAK